MAFPQKFPVLQTRRLTLRELTASDAEAIFQMRANRRVNQFIGRPQMEEEEQASQLIDRVQEAQRNQAGLAWAGILRDGQTIIGTCGFNRFEWENLRAEIGGELDPVYWGKGLPQEALVAIMDCGFTRLDLHAIEAKVNPSNRGAIFLLEKLGFVREGLFRERYLSQGAWHDLAHYTCFANSFVPDAFAV